ncbi:MAG: glycosyltransferase family 4 protein [Magnetococcales bacterium]|nr:glycosyltransferase family 4 protein [Magnetococcales bacterium]
MPPFRDADGAAPIGERVYLYYHFFYPDEVVSARHFGDLAEGLAQRGWQVTVFTSNRYCRRRGAIEKRRERWRGVEIVRLWRPGLDQSRHLSRLINAVWIMAAWLWATWRAGAPRAFLVGTDPQFSQLLFPGLKGLFPRSHLLHWCFDLYPEALLADAPDGALARLAKVVQGVMGWFYRRVDHLVDLGPCMRRRLARYGHGAAVETITPWALVEPEELPRPDAEVRRALFGEARLVLLYSGNLGRAHEFNLFLDLAALLEEGVVMAFGCSGSRVEELRAAMASRKLANVRLLPFAAEAELEGRLAAADIHLLSLRPDWDGVVVPSKFFGSLAVGRPVVYHGSRESAVGIWVEQHALGFVLNPDNVVETANRLNALAHCPEELYGMSRRAFSTYRQAFSKAAMLERWHTIVADGARPSG